ncbi:heme ABC transporter permease [Afifella pfennigii]|uniref:heme ABC transporter permease n=1 Tax=Afifella pfennigii TaxID=209897 RepID=UPI00068F6144|nr:heme ABC transporter permease [Afifella pfennigii]
MGVVSSLANPTRFLSWSSRLLPIVSVLAALTLAVGVYWSLFVAPPDYQQGDSVRIMFIHVPAAYLAMFCYVVMAAAALGTLVWRHPLADVSARAAAPIGAAFTFLALFTGSVWGKPMWGAWWVWDARLTSVLVLFIMYLGLIALWRAFDDPSRGAKVAAILILVGFINIPVIKFSVDWWNTLHQPASIVRMDGPTIDPSMLWPLLVMIAGYTLTFIALHLAAMRAEIYRRRARTTEMLIAARPASTAVRPTEAAATGAPPHTAH